MSRSNLICVTPQKKINSILKKKWLALSDEDKAVWKSWESWDTKRFARDEKIYAYVQKSVSERHGSNKRDRSDSSVGIVESQANLHIPKRRKR
jgi:hypothetical protein